jgi:hypothetical protein
MGEILVFQLAGSYLCEKYGFRFSNFRSKGERIRDINDWDQVKGQSRLRINAPYGQTAGGGESGQELFTELVGTSEQDGLLGQGVCREESS